MAKTAELRWLPKYHKFKRVFFEINPLCDRIQRDINRIDNANLSAINFHDGETTLGSLEEENLNELNAMFMYSYLLKDILIKMDFGKQAKEQFVNFCRIKYADNRFALYFIDEFEQNYEKHSPVWWYTRESLIYPMLNQALREHDTETLFKMGFFIKDLHQQLEQIHSLAVTNTDTLVVYRGQSVSNKEFIKIKSSPSGLISFNSFLSTTPDRLLAQGFAEGQLGNSETKAILFKMNICSEIRSSPFASLNGLSYMEEEDEILFSMHTVFRIQSIQQQTNQPEIWEVHLKLTSAEVDQNLALLTEHMREELEGGTSLHKLGQLTARMGEYDRAQEIYELLILSSPIDDKKGLAFLRHQLGVVYTGQGNLDDALSHYQKSLDLELKYLPPNHPQLGPTYSNIGMIYEDKHELDRALEYYQKALEIDLGAPELDQQSASVSYNNIGGVLLRLGRFEEALENYNRCLELQLKSLPPTHPQIGALYSNMGVVCLDRHDWSQALDYFNKGLTIQRKSVPPNHPSLAITHYNIALAYDGLLQYIDAIKYGQQAYDIAMHTFPSNHPECLTYEVYLNKLRSKL
ncbi:unnamed protein product [Rotaria sp. Silwood1]|nr:unnamed protein product [Rotaria sp. Silwood1]CAF4704609.1 unnamed protein product [Rotaria sp. Silwood1]